MFIRPDLTPDCDVSGTPHQPEYGGWAFNLARGQECLNKWNLIPEDVDVLVTHSPPLGFGDLTSTGVRAGCVELLHSVQRRIKPKYHVYGHIHEGKQWGRIISREGQDLFQVTESDRMERFSSSTPRPAISTTDPATPPLSLMSASRPATPECEAAPGEGRERERER